MGTYQNKRTAHRWRLGAGITIGLAFALGSFYWLQMMNVADMNMHADGQRGEPDYIIEKFSFVRMNAQGKPRYIISGDKLTHRPVDDTSEVDRPYVQNLSDDQKPPMTMRAKDAHLDNTAGTVLLRGDVHIEREQSAAGPRLTVDTQSLLIDTDDEQMQTDQPVHLTHGAMIVDGRGMVANNTTGKATIAHDVRITYPPKNK